MASLSFMAKGSLAESSLAPISQQQGSYQLTGTILDGMGEPVIGANVLVKGTTNGVVTDLKWKVQFTSKAKRHFYKSVISVIIHKKWQSKANIHLILP